MLGNEGIEEFTGKVWEALDHSNRISLFVRYIDWKSGRSETKIINVHGEENR